MAAGTDLQSEFKQAMADRKAGRFNDALHKFRAILRKDPSRADAHFQAGMILLQLNLMSEGIERLRSARNLAPNQPQVWQAYMSALASGGQADELEKATQDLKRAPMPAEVKQKLMKGISKTDRATYGNANRAMVDQAVKALLDNRPADALNIVEPLYRQAPDSTALLNVLASAHEALGNRDDADRFFRNAVLIEPMSGPIRTNYGRFLLQAGQPVLAAVHLQVADQIIANNPKVKLLLAQALRRGGRLLESQAIGRDLEALAPQLSAARLHQARIFIDLDRPDDAMMVANEIIEKEGPNADAFYILGQAHQMSGAFDDAQAAMQKAIEHDPNRVGAFLTIARSYKFQPDDPLLEKMEDLYEENALVPADKAALGFAIAKAHEDAKQYDRVFPYLKSSNALVAEADKHDPEQAVRRMDAVKRLVDFIDLDRVRANSDNEFAPIFITGIPRSGTTLTEQIVGSHSTVTPVGEATWRSDAFAPARANLDLEGIGQEKVESQLISAGQRYEELARLHFPQVERIADKALGGYYLLGLVAASLPKSRTVIIRRDPRDNLFSIYKNHFVPGNQTFNSDMRELARTYAHFLAVLDYWREVMPGSFYELQYEDLIAEPEAETRKLLEYCELDWEDQVMEHHKSKSTVRTLSTFQARQPIYQTSVKSWQRYETELQPLFDALEEFGVMPKE